MELTKEMKEKVEKAENKEEAKKILKQAGLELTDGELDQIAGGSNPRIPHLSENWTARSNLPHEGAVALAKCGAAPFVRENLVLSRLKRPFFPEKWVDAMYTHLKISSIVDTVLNDPLFREMISFIF